MATDKLLPQQVVKCIFSFFKVRPEERGRFSLRNTAAFKSEGEQRTNFQWKLYDQFSCLDVQVRKRDRNVYIILVRNCLGKWLLCRSRTKWHNSARTFYVRYTNFRLLVAAKIVNFLAKPFLSSFPVAKKVFFFSFRLSVCPSALISLSPTVEDLREIWNSGLRKTCPEIPKRCWNLIKKMSGTLHEVTVCVIVTGDI